MTEHDILDHFQIIVTVAASLLAVITGVILLRTKGMNYLKTRRRWKTKIMSMPGILETIRKDQKEIKGKLSFFESELRANGGTSLKDEVSLLVREKLIELKEAPYPLVRVTSEGNHVFVNYAYEVLVDDHGDGSLGHGWMQYLEEMEEAEELLRRWVEVTRKGLRFTDMVRFIDTGKRYRGEWKAKAVPIGPYDSGKTRLWCAKLYPHDEVAKKIAENHQWVVQ